MVNPNLFNDSFDGSSFTLEGSSKGLLLFHGFTATTLEVRGLAEYMHAHLGLTVEVPLLPGHGTTPEDLSQTGFEEWLSTAEDSLDHLKQKTNSIIVGGESMGGLLALHLAALHPEISGLLIFAPALVTPGMQKARWLRNFIFGSHKKGLTSTQPGFLPWQGYRINPLKAVVELGKLQEKVKLHLSEIHQPMLLFQGKQDKTIDPKSSLFILNAVSSKEKVLIEMENCGHCVLLDAQHDMVYDKSVSFLESIPF